MRALLGFFGQGVGLVLFMFAGPVTFILGVIDTWQTDLPVWGKLLINLTFDAALAVIWPITWLLWIAGEILNIWTTPLSSVLGLF